MDSGSGSGSGSEKKDKHTLYKEFFMNHVIPFEYCLYIQTKLGIDDNDMNNDHKIDDSFFPIQTFQEYIDTNFNLRTLGSYDYTHFLISIKEPTFKKNLFTQYQREMKKRQLKNEIIHTDVPLFINMVAYYEYKSFLQSSNNDLYNKDERNYKKVKDFERITFEQIDHFFQV